MTSLNKKEDYTFVEWIIQYIYMAWLWFLIPCVASLGVLTPIMIIILLIDFSISVMSWKKTIDAPSIVGSFLLCFFNIA